VTSDERRQDLLELERRLGSGALDVELQIAEYEPGYRGVTLLEVLGIYVGLRVSDKVIDALVGDLYKKAKAWATARYRRKQAQGRGMRGESFTIYGPDGKRLKTWRIDKDGEHED
jgi:hypothetical protein